jgi:hypothetical protein
MVSDQECVGQSEEGALVDARAALSDAKNLCAGAIVKPFTSLRVTEEGICRRHRWRFCGGRWFDWSRHVTVAI